MTGEIIKSCRTILGDAQTVSAPDAVALKRCGAILEVLIGVTKGLCERAVGTQNPVTRFEVLNGVEALFRGIDVEHRAVRVILPEIDEVMKVISVLRKSPGFRKTLADAMHGVVVDQDITWEIVPLLRDVVNALEQIESLLASHVAKVA
jgi:hypothetical protein